MGECICIKGVAFDRDYFHSASLVRGTDPKREEYFGNLIVSVNFIIPNIAGNQAILNTMLIKETDPIGTIDLYRRLLTLLRVIDNHLPSRDGLIEDLLTADEKALMDAKFPVVEAKGDLSREFRPTAEEEK